MPEQALILDLDDTLINSSMLADLRRAKKWRQCVDALDRTELYDGVKEVVTELTAQGVFIGIVTSSVSYYANAVLNYHDIPYDVLIAYHDRPWNQQKPHPAPVLLCLSKFGVSAPESLGLGDSIIDAQAYTQAGISAWGAGWSSKIERDSRWDRVIEDPKAIISFFK